MISIIDFYANWCNPCKKLEPHLKEIEINYPDIKVRKINIEDENQKELIDKYNINSLPTLLIIDEDTNKILSKIEGFNLPLILEEIGKYA